MVARNTKPARKIKPRATSRNSAVTKIVEEKHIGREIVDWSQFQDEASVRMKVIEALRHYGYFYEASQSRQWVLQYCKKNLPDIVKQIQKVNDSAISTSLGATAKIIMDGAPISRDYLDRQLHRLAERTSIGSIGQVESTPPVVTKSKSPAVLMAEKTDRLLSEMEGILDSWSENKDFSTYDHLLKEIASYNTAKSIADYYRPLVAELEELVKNKPADLVEGYSHMTLSERKEYLTFVSSIVTDAEKFMASKKAVRAIRKPKVKSAATLVSKVKYLKTSNEFKVSSVDPQSIVGASKVFLFDVRTRNLTILETSNFRGLTIKGTTIQDAESVQQKKVRKPEETLVALSKATKNKAMATFNGLTTKVSAGSGRIGVNTIIMKVF